MQMLVYICGMNKLKWPRCLSLLKKILNLEEVFKKICKRNLLFTVCFSMLFFTEVLYFFRLTQSESRSAKSNTRFHVGELMLQNDMMKDNGFRVKIDKEVALK